MGGPVQWNEHDSDAAGQSFTERRRIRAKGLGVFAYSRWFASRNARQFAFSKDARAQAIARRKVRAVGPER
eukprot:2984356-Lingulodinium_polyedra.AAC.1